MRPVPLLALNTTAKWPNRNEAISPAQIAAGGGDAFLLALNRAIAGFGGELYLRPFGEMNGHWNVYSAFTASGHAKPGHSTASFRQAFARVYLIAHGGPLAIVNAALARLRLPPVRGSTLDLATNPFPTLRVIWNPQGYGSPDIPANSAQAYYPGDRFVDVVGDDLYDIRGKAEWPAADALYKAHPSKPFAFPEWGLWGLDDPAFVQRMHDFVLAHRRTELIAYFESVPGSVFDLGDEARVQGRVPAPDHHARVVRRARHTWRGDPPPRPHRDHAVGEGASARSRSTSRCSSCSGSAASGSWRR